jgi:uncharacterized protein YabN with tetrapyrrole methylase and pyrophosphatase domain
VEEQVLRQGKTWSECSLAELDELWNAAKAQEKSTADAAS